ncbi:MAG: outer membrane protein assembly factor BamA [Lentisphaerae bacterium]|nr:outer membrane protein assembly factor BamA [Lentisphaerota bacterium]
MRRCCTGGMVLWLAAVALAGAAADEAPVVRDVEVRHAGPGRLDASFVQAQLSVEPGTALDRMAIARDVRAVLDTGAFSDVTASVEPSGDGVRVVYTVVPRLRLAGPVTVQGADYFDAAHIRDLLKLQPGDPVDEQIVGLAAQRVEKAYREERFNDVNATWDIAVTNEAAGRAAVTLRVDEGARRRIRGARFEGNTALSDGTLRRAMQIPSRWNPWRMVFPKSYDREAMETGRFRIQDLYRDRGYLDVSVRIEGVTRDAAGNAVVRVSIDEGICYRWGQFALEGITLFPEAELQRLITLEEGATASAAALETAAGTLRNYYGSRGYIQTTVRPVLTPRPEAGRVDVRFVVNEGELVRIRNIRIRGNTRTRDKVIRRELLVYPGERYDEVRVQKSERRLMNLGYFERVTSAPERTPVPDERDLAFEVEEKRTGRFMLGAGFSSVDKLIGFVEVAQGNFDIKGWPTFTGGGQKLKLYGQFGAERNDWGISFVEPWFLDRKLSLGLDLYRKDFSYDDYDIERSGGSISVGKALPYASRIDFRYQLEDSMLDDLSDDDLYVDRVTGEAVSFEEEGRIGSSFRVAVTHDSRDNPFVATRGVRTTVFGELTGGILGFDTDTYALGMRAKQYWPLWWGHVFSLEGRYEIIERYGDTDVVPTAERLFLGGGRTLRGFGYREVGPKAVPDPEAAEAGETDSGDAASVSYRPYGGQSLAMATAEYTMPVVPYVRLAGFYDTGGVWRDPFDFETDSLASSAGVGIRLDMPGFPIRIDRAWVVEKDDELTDEDAWTIWIGYD